MPIYRAAIEIAVDGPFANNPLDTTMIQMMMNFIVGFGVLCAFIACILFIVGFIIAVARAAFETFRAMKAPLLPEEKCCFCPRPRRPNHASCGKCD